MDTVIEYWHNPTPPRTILLPASGHILTAADLAKFTLGNFVSSTTGIQPITGNPPPTNNYKLELNATGNAVLVLE
jgi:hypothetical protein